MQVTRPVLQQAPRKDPGTEMSVCEAILSRRSVRNFTSQQTDLYTVNILLEAAVRAPTAMREPCVFFVIQDQRLLNSLSDFSEEMFNKQVSSSNSYSNGHSREASDGTETDTNIFFNAGTLIVIGSYIRGDLVTADCWLAAGNLIMTACSMGLGSCIVANALPVINDAEIKQGFGIPAEYSAIAPIVIGYPSTDTMPSARREPVVIPLR